MYLPRTLEPFIRSSSRNFPSLLVTGPRQVGKTTLLRNLSRKGRTYVTLDDPLALRLAREEPGLFFQRFPPPVFLDEIQYAPGLLPYIKMEVDRDRTPGRFWLTGSQHFLLMKGVSESLAGRVGLIQMLGLSRAEKEKQPKGQPFLPTPEAIRKIERVRPGLTLEALYRIIWLGGYPSLILNPKPDRDLFYSSYVQTYLQRDVRDLARVGDETAFLRFLRGTAARTGQLLNLLDLARDADVAPNTAKNWLSILQASGIIYLLEPYHSNITKRLVKTSKLYFLDTGLAAYLTEWSSPKTLEAGAMSGPLLETWVFSELLKSYWHNGRQAPFYYYRDKDKKEIDLLIFQDWTLYPLEIKKTASPGTSDIRHFQALDKLNIPVKMGGIICLTDRWLPLSSRTLAIPAWSL